MASLKLWYHAPMSLITHKCPKCAGRLEFNSSLQMMQCPFCDSVYDPLELQELDQVLATPPGASTQMAPTFAPPPIPGTQVAIEADQANKWLLPNRHWEEGEQEDMYVYTCSTCAGAIVSDQTLGATNCPYCDNPVVITDRFKGDLKPDLVIPFKLDKDTAKAALLKHYEGKHFLPLRFKDENRIDEIKGVYIPFWLFDSICLTDAVYHCTKVDSYTEGDYDITETSNYSVSRTGNIEFNYVPVDGSSQLADDLMQSIEPFNYTDLVQFQTAYLAGYSTNVYDVDAPTAITAAQNRMGATAEEVLRSSVQGYSTVDLERVNIDFQKPRCSYALLPVWLLSTIYDNKVYTFAMNGQTGLFVGDLPVDKTRRRNYFMLTWGIIALVILILAFVFGWVRW